MSFRKKKQTAWKKALPDDIIIPVMGPTGVGKSTFINYLAGGDAVKVGHDLRSCTADLRPVTIPPSHNSLLGGRRLVIVDTPGFDDTYLSDSEILGRIASWLEDAYRSETKLSGVIYLHDISLARMLGTTRKNLEVFQKLCGDDALRSVILGTTKWGEIYKDDGERRVTQLCEHYWKDMLDHGSKVYRFEDSSASAWGIVGSIIETNGNRAEVLKIQEELVDMSKLLPDTEAGQKLRGDLDQVLKKLKEDHKNHKKGSAKRQELASQITQIQAQMKAMQIPVSQRVSRFLNLGVDKIMDRFALTVRAYQPPIARLGTDCRELILLLGESGEGKKKLLDLLSAKEHHIGNDHDSSAAQEVKYWSVTREGTFIGTLGFDPSGDTLEVLQRIWILLQNSCREDMQVGVIYLRGGSASSGFDAASSTDSPPTVSPDTDAIRPATGSLPAFSSEIATSVQEIVYGAAPAAGTYQGRARSAQGHELPARLSPSLASSSTSIPARESKLGPTHVAVANGFGPSNPAIISPPDSQYISDPSDLNAPPTQQLPATTRVTSPSSNTTSPTSPSNTNTNISIALEKTVTSPTVTNSADAPPLEAASNIPAFSGNTAASPANTTAAPGNPSVVGSTGKAGADPPAEKSVAQHRMLSKEASQLALSSMTVPPAFDNVAFAPGNAASTLGNTTATPSNTGSAPSKAVAAPGNRSAFASNVIVNAVFSDEPVALAQYQSSSPKVSLELARPQMTIPSTLPPSVNEWFQSSPLAKTTLFATLTAAKVHTSKIDESGGEVDGGFTEFQGTAQGEALRMLGVVVDKALPFGEMLQPENNKDKLKGKKGLLSRLLSW